MKKQFIFIILTTMLFAGLLTNCSDQINMNPVSPDTAEQAAAEADQTGIMADDQCWWHHKKPYPPAEGKVTVKTQVITISKDAELRERSANNNYGGSTSIKISSMSGQRAFLVMDFDLSPIPSNATIINAKLSMVNINRNNINVIIYPLLTSWEEMQVTWNSPWTTPGGDINKSISTSAVLLGRGATSLIDITPFIQFLYNTPGSGGITMQMTNYAGADAQVYTREATQAPSLTVIYSVTVASPAEQIQSALSQILALNNSSFFHHNGWMAKHRFKKMCNTAIFFINRHKTHQAKMMIRSIIRLMDGKYFDLITNAAARDQIRPLFEQILSEL